MKKILIILLFFLVLSTVQAQTIQNYTIPETVPLYQTLTIDGKINPQTEGVLCSFRIYDVNKSRFVKRLTDEFTTSGGVFSSSYLVVTEPEFWRTSDYNVITDCNGVIASGVFHVTQKIGVNNFFFGELFYLRDNGHILILAGVFILILLIFISWFWVEYSKTLR